VTDMVSGIEIYDPLFEWPAIPGAASYQIEINLTSGFAPGSLIFSGSTTADVVRPHGDAANNAVLTGASGASIRRAKPARGNNGPTFTKTYDETPLPGPQVLHVYNSSSSCATTRNVNEPVIQWSTVPGARTYEIQVSCPGVSKSYTTVNTSWTPLSRTAAALPFIFSQPGPGFSTDSPPLNAGSCVAGVRAYADNAIDGSAIAGTTPSSASRMPARRSPIRRSPTAPPEPRVRVSSAARA